MMTGTGMDAATQLIQAGPWGAATVLVGLFFFIVWKRERDRADKADAKVDALVRELLDKVVPALVDSARAQHDFVQYARDSRGTGHG